MNCQHYLETIEPVLTWDLTEVDFTDAIKLQTMENDSSEHAWNWDHYLHNGLTTNN